VALGDSYSSGEGTYNYLTGTDTSNDRCHRSPDAYPLILGNVQYGVKLPSQITFKACSRASISNFYNREWKDEAPQLDAICTPQPYVQPSAGAPPPCSDNSVQLVTLSVGGDDAGFQQILEACVTNRKDQQRCLGQDPYVTFGGSVPDQDSACSFPCFNDNLDPTYPGVEKLERGLRQLYMDIRGRAPHARILVMGYPRIFPVGGADDNSCHLNKRDQTWLTAKDQEADAIIRSAVNASGVAEYVDTFLSMNSHEACQGLNASIPWINGLVLLTHGPFGGCIEVSPLVAYCPESFHPTPDGYKAFARSVAVQLQRTSPGACGDGCTWQSRTVSPTDAFQIDVPAGTAVASFSTSWTTKTDVTMSLTAPDGTVYNRQAPTSGFNHANGDGYEYYNLPAGDPSNPDPAQAVQPVASGAWTVSLSTAATSAVPVTFQLGLATLRDPTPAAAFQFNGTLHTPPAFPHAPPPFSIVRFDATASSDPDGRIASYSWEFGDGTTGTGAHVEHKYFGPAKYCPLLIVTDESGQIGYAGAKVLVATDDPGDCV
jgi:lysophospholipase L1-like esterase